MDAITQLGYLAAAKQAGLLDDAQTEKQAMIPFRQIASGLWNTAKKAPGLLGKTNEVVTSGLGKALTKPIVGGGRRLALKRTLGTGIGGYTAYGAYNNMAGNYDKPADNTLADHQNLPGWRRQNRTIYTRNSQNPGEVQESTNMGQWFKDLVKNPGRTLTEGMGYGAEGPDSFWDDTPGDMVRSYQDPISGANKGLQAVDRRQIWSPKVQAHQNLTSNSAQDLGEFGPGAFQNMELPAQLGEQAARQAYTNGPQRYDWSLYHHRPEDAQYGPENASYGN
jgi:hypothetical protein